jgi:hypothetical protein
MLYTLGSTDLDGFGRKVVSRDVAVGKLVGFGRPESNELPVSLVVEHHKHVTGGQVHELGCA